jgi:UMF1 family MFS transporter
MKFVIWGLSVSLFFFGTRHLVDWSFSTVLASIGFWEVSFYNSYLPEIAFPEQQDRVIKVYVFGYAGSLILLGFNLTMVMMPEWYGISDGSLPAQHFFLSVGIWWIGLQNFTIIFFTRNRRKTISLKDSESKVVLNNLKYFKSLKQFLIAFFFIALEFKL